VASLQDCNIECTLFADKEKDLGIPSKFPFKDQILADAAELKVKVCSSLANPAGLEEEMN
jgi:hypothetical protein